MVLFCVAVVFWPYYYSRLDCECKKILPEIICQKKFCKKIACKKMSEKFYEFIGHAPGKSDILGVKTGGFRAKMP